MIIRVILYYAHHADFPLYVYCMIHVAVACYLHVCVCVFAFFYFTAWPTEEEIELQGQMVFFMS